MAGVAVAAATQVAAAEEEEEEEEKKVRDSRRVRLPLRTTLPRFFPSLFSFSAELCSSSLSRASRQPWPRNGRIKGRVRSLSRSLSLSLSPSGEFDGRRKNAGRRRRGRKRKEETRQLANPGNGGRGGGEEDGAFSFRGIVVGDFGYKGETFRSKDRKLSQDSRYQLSINGEREREGDRER